VKLFCIADEDTVRGFRLAGVAGQVVSDAGEAVDAVKRAAAMPGLGLLIVTDVVASEAQAEIDRIRLECVQPLIAEIPGPDGPMEGRKTLREFVQEAVGISVGEEEDGER
jgi:V/A-type H+-transporting ATPase subunit F